MTKDLNITKYLAEHGLKASRAYTESSVKVFKGDDLAFELKGSELALYASEEDTFNHVKSKVEEYEQRLNK